MEKFEQSGYQPDAKQISDFISGYERFKNEKDFNLHSKLAEEFNGIGKPELAERWALAFLKKQIDVHLQKKLGVSHTLSKAYAVMAYEAKLDNELKKDLGEMLAKLYESGGRFTRAYELYRENYPDKYSEKLKSVKMTDEITPGLKEERQWVFQIPNDRRSPESFPDFKKINPDEAEENETILFEDFLKKVPEEVMKIDTVAEMMALLAEAKSIKEDLEQKSQQS